MTGFMHRDIKYKIISLVLAVIIWLYVRGELGKPGFFYHQVRGQSKRTFENIPIRILEVSSNEMRSVVVKPERITLDVSVPRALINTFQIKDIMVFVKVAGLRDGSYETLVQVDVPEGVLVLSEIKPVQLTIKTPPSRAGLAGLIFSQELIPVQEKVAL